MKTCTDYERGFMAGWRDRADYAERTKLTFDDGVRAGYAQASRLLHNAIAETIAPLPYNARQIVQQLIRTWDWQDCRAAADASGPRPGDHLGRTG